MAKIRTTPDGVNHLVMGAGTLCDSQEQPCSLPIGDGTLTCPDCAKIALAAIETSTKAERREWRKL